jgi:hypothetical protein
MPPGKGGDRAFCSKRKGVQVAGLCTENLEQMLQPRDQKQSSDMVSQIPSNSQNLKWTK